MSTTKSKKKKEPKAKAKPKAKPEVKKPDPEKVAEQKQQEKRGHELMLASSKGFALSHAYLDSSVDAIGKLMGDKFKVTLEGLSVKGKLTEVEAAKAVATLAEVTERGDIVRGTSMLALGDLVVGVKAQLGEQEGDELINQAVSLVGRSKHTCQEAERVAIAFPHSGRPKGLSYTHLQILKDAKGSGEVAPAKLSQIIETVQEGEVVATVIIDGKKKEQRKPLSVKATKKLLDEARGKNGDKPSAKSKPKGTISGGYLYTELEDANSVFHSEELDQEAVKSKDYSIVSLNDGSVLDDKGHLYAKVQPLPVKKVVKEAKAEPKKDEKKKSDEKPKSEKPSKKEADDADLP